MSYINVGSQTSGEINIYYEDQGKGRPVILIHGWPLSSASWGKQVEALLKAGYRVIAYDRRGFGQSSKPANDYNYDTFTEDLNKIITKLDLNDIVLVGFSMGGGEVARYLGKYCSRRVSKAVFISSVGPYLIKTEDNIYGFAEGFFNGIKKAITENQTMFLQQFFSDFYNLNSSPNIIGKEVIQSNMEAAMNASKTALLECVSAWKTDFRQDLEGVDIPVLVIHGDSDRILPLSITGQRISETIKGAKLSVIEGGPHGLTWTHANQINQQLLEFLSKGKPEELWERISKPSSRQPVR